MFTKWKSVASFFLSIIVVFTVAEENLIAHLNYDLEIDSEAPDFHWIPHEECTFQTVNVSYGGSRSLSVSNRTENISSATLILDQSIVQPGKSYHYSFYINFLNTPAELQHFNVTLKSRTKVLEGEEYIYYSVSIGQLKFIRGGTGWLYLGGDIRLEDKDFEEVRFILDFDKRVNYLFDTAVLVELPQFDPDTWKTQLNDTITAERTNLITIQTNISDAFQPSDTVIQVDQTLNSFHFGSAIMLADFYDSTTFGTNYRNFFFENFNMGVPTNYVKWKHMENPKGTYNTEEVDLFISDADQRGITVRAHAIVWSRYTAQPHWLVDFTADPIGDPVEVRQELSRYIEWFCGYYGNKFAHFDVYNEHLHTQFYEDFLLEPDLLYDVFRASEENNCTGVYFINDFALVNRGTSTSAQMNLANKILDAELKLDAIGAQSHIKANDFDLSSLELLEKRTNLLCSTGLPVMITEMSIENENVTTRASKLEQVLMFYYSKPCIFGVNYWTLSDQNTDPLMTLVDGVDVEPNEAGQVWIDLVKGQWETHRMLTPTERSESFQFPGHHGDYSVTVTNGGEVVQTSSFTLTKGQDVVVPVNL